MFPCWRFQGTALSNCLSLPFLFAVTVVKRKLIHKTILIVYRNSLQQNWMSRASASTFVKQELTLTR